MVWARGDKGRDPDLWPPNADEVCPHCGAPAFHHPPVMASYSDAFECPRSPDFAPIFAQAESGDDHLLSKRLRDVMARGGRPWGDTKEGREMIAAVERARGIAVPMGVRRTREQFEHWCEIAPKSFAEALERVLDARQQIEQAMGVPAVPVNAKPARAAKPAPAPRASKVPIAPLHHKRRINNEDE